jgi:hypothetical protein
MLGGGLGKSDALGPGGSTLKVTAPTPTAPVDDEEIVGVRPELAVANASGRYVDVFDLSYRFQIFGAEGDTVFEALAASGDGTTTVTTDADLPADASYTWRARAELDQHVGPWSDTAGFRIRPLGPAPYGPVRTISPEELLKILILVHNDGGYDLGSSSTHAYRVDWLWTAVAVGHYGHPRLNPDGGDRNWCVKNNGPGRPNSDDVIVRCNSREFWDTIGSVGADGYHFRLERGEEHTLPSEQPVFPPPLESLPD